MERDHIGMLWENRFHKIFKMEQESLDFYRELSQKDELIGESPRLREILEEILDDEERHSFISKELLRIVRRKLKKSQLEEEGQVE